MGTQEEMDACVVYVGVIRGRTSISEYARDDEQARYSASKSASRKQACGDAVWHETWLKLFRALGGDI